MMFQVNPLLENQALFSLKDKQVNKSTACGCQRSAVAAFRKF